MQHPLSILLLPVTKIKHLVISLVIFIIINLFSCGLSKPLGQNPQGEVLERLKQLPNYKNGRFQNLPSRNVVTAGPTKTVRRRGPRWLFMFRSRKETIKPSLSLPWVKVDLKAVPVAPPTVVWFGHSSVLVKTAQGNLLFDPIFSNHAGPIPGIVKAFKGSMNYHAEDMPPLEAVVISHDHYDHMDYRTLIKLKDKAKLFIVPMGLSSHLLYWGFDPKKIIELNWHQSATSPGGLRVTATPAHHRSNRTFSEESKTLWASYVIQTDNYKLFFSGDGGYADHFKQIGQQYGPFDLAFLECGQYSPNWPASHMMPEQTAQAAADLKASVFQPIHWAKFAESDHSWNEPILRVLPAAKKLNIDANVPRLGEPYMLGEPLKTTVWWDFE